LARGDHGLRSQQVRNQLWAEAAFREAKGESIRMDQALYAAAGVEQDRRLSAHDDPFTNTLQGKLGDRSGRITSENVWKLLGFLDASRRPPDLLRRLGQSMKVLG
jgi:hypothetical protein